MILLIYLIGLSFIILKFLVISNNDSIKLIFLGARLFFIIINYISLFFL